MKHSIEAIFFSMVANRSIGFSAQANIINDLSEVKKDFARMQGEITYDGLDYPPN